MATIVDPNRYNELCRLCAEKTTMLLGVHIFQSDGIIGQIRKKIESCLPIQVHEADELPKMVCENCLYKLNMLSDFRERTVRTEQLLLNLVKATRSMQQNQACIVQMDHNDLIIHQQLLTTHGISNVDEIDLSQLGTTREQLIQHEIILTHQNVEGLEGIELNHHELTSQELSNHSLQHGDGIMVEASHHHEMDNARFAGDNLDLIHHQQLLQEQFRLHHELHGMDARAVNEITMGDPLADPMNGATIHHKMDESVNNNANGYHTLHHQHEDVKKQNFHDSSNDHYTLHHEAEGLSPKLEDSNSNSNNSLLIDEQQYNTIHTVEHGGTITTDVGTSKTVYQILPDTTTITTTTTTNSTAASSSSAGNEDDKMNGKDWVYCNICGKGYEGRASFEEHYDMHFHKCEVCAAVFTSTDVLDAHKKEAHHGDGLEQQPRPVAIVRTRLKRATMPIKDESNSEDSGGDYADEPAEQDLEDEEEEEEEEEEDNEEVETKPDVSGGNKPASSSSSSGAASKRKTWSPKVCTECGKAYKTNYKLNEHMRKHTGEKPYKCDMCEKEFRSKIGLAQHAAKHTGKYDYSCPICGKGFQCKSYLMVHQRVHSDIKPYPCTTCGRNFKTKQSLLDHTNRHLGVKPYMCETCGRGFITKGLCKAHQKVHTGLDNRKYSCKVCEKMFVSKSYLQTHLRIHTGEKPFICEVCGKGFLTKVDLRIHTTMHTGEKSYVCEMCGKAFARRDALRCHRRSHTGERPYSCDLCGQTFTQFTPMAIHKRLHTGERPYACEVCGKTFVSRSTMMSHAKKHQR